MFDKNDVVKQIDKSLLNKFFDAFKHKKDKEFFVFLVMYDKEGNVY